MKSEGIVAFLIPSEDDHQSVCFMSLIHCHIQEYTPLSFQRRSYVSGIVPRCFLFSFAHPIGFTGSMGLALVGLQQNWLWTDGRYYNQGSELVCDFENEMFAFVLFVSVSLLLLFSFFSFVRVGILSLADWLASLELSGDWELMKVGLPQTPSPERFIAEVRRGEWMGREERREGKRREEKRGEGKDFVWFCCVFVLFCLFVLCLMCCLFCVCVCFMCLRGFCCVSFFGSIFFDEAFNDLLHC
jgi:hypothetical protein